MSEQDTYNYRVVRQFSLMTVVWGVVGMLVGVIIAAQLTWPELNVGPWFSYGRLRPLHTNAVIFAFGGCALFATSYYVVQRTCHARLFCAPLAAFTFWGWQAVIVLAAVTLPLGFTSGKALRDGLLALTRGHAGFLRMMAQNALLVQPPLGMVRDFVVDDDGAYAGSIDLKTAGARLFVDAARIFALAHGVAGTNTAQRLHYAGTRMNLGADEISSAVEGFNFIQQQRLRQQVAAPQGAGGGANRVNPDALNEVDRRILKEALRQARKLQSRLALDYHL